MKNSDMQTAKVTGWKRRHNVHESAPATTPADIERINAMFRGILDTAVYLASALLR